MRLIISGLLLLSAAPAFSQLSVDNSGLTVLSGTTLYSQGLVLTPSADLSLSNNELSVSATPVAGTGGASISRVYEFSSPVVFSGIVGIRYLASEINGNTEGLMQIAHGVQPGGGAYTTSDSGTGAAASYYVYNTVNGVSFSRLTAVNAGVNLPVELLRFDARAAGDYNLLGWDVAAERDLLGYEAQRSEDGSNFRSIGFVAANGQNSYQLRDAAPAAARVWYRLKIMEQDGGFRYSATISLNRNAAAPALAAYPNPAAAVLTVETPGATAQAAMLTLSDLSGRQLLACPVTGTQTRLDLSGIPAGCYMLHYHDGLQRQTLRIVRQ